MFIYEVDSAFYNEEEHDNNYVFEYLIHERKFTLTEFNTICMKALEHLSSKDAYSLKNYLINNYDFRDLPLTCYFSFEEE